MDPSVLTLLDRLYRFGQDNDAQITERPKWMLNITADTGRLLWIVVRLAHAKRILEVGTSNGFSTIWLADTARSTGGRVTTLEVNPTRSCWPARIWLRPVSPTSSTSAKAGPRRLQSGFPGCLRKERADQRVHGLAAALGACRHVLVMLANR